MEQEQSSAKNRVFIYIISLVSLIVSFFIIQNTVGMLSVIVRYGFLESFAVLGFYFHIGLALIGAVLAISFKIARSGHSYHKIVTWIYWVLVATVLSTLLFFVFYPVQQHIREEKRQREFDLSVAYPIASVELNILEDMPKVMPFPGKEFLNPWTQGRAVSVTGSKDGVMWDEETGVIRLTSAPDAYARIYLKSNFTDKPFNAIIFDYRLISEDESYALFSALLNDTPLLGITAQSSTLSPDDRGLIHTSGIRSITPARQEYQKGGSVLQFRLESIPVPGINNYPSTVEIYNIRVGIQE